MLDGSMESALFGEDFGARDATPGEIESNFSDKVRWVERDNIDAEKEPFWPALPRRDALSLCRFDAALCGFSTTQNIH